mgnify:CR=1 FL=1
MATMTLREALDRARAIGRSPRCADCDDELPDDPALVMQHVMQRHGWRWTVGAITGR